MTSQVVVVGGGLAAIATAHALVGRRCQVVLIEEREPTSAGPASEVECYRPWWPGDEVTTRLATRGVDLLEGLQVEGRGAFAMNRRGHFLLAVEPESATRLRAATGRYAAAGGGPLREHASADWFLPAPSDGVRGVPGGLDLLEGRALLGVLPCLSPQARLGVMVRRAGWVDGRALRRWLGASFRAAGGTVTSDSLSGASVRDGEGWSVSLASGLKLRADGIVLAGPRAAALGRRIGLEVDVVLGTNVTAVLGGAAAFLGSSPPIVSLLNPPGAEEGSPPVIRADGADLRIERFVPGELPVGADGTGLGEAALRRLALALPFLRTHRGPPDRLSIGLTTTGMGSDRRPVAGVLDRRGCYVVTGLASDVGVVLGAVELVAEYLGGTALPAVAAAVAPGRLPLPIDF